MTSLQLGKVVASQRLKKKAETKKKKIEWGIVPKKEKKFSESLNKQVDCSSTTTFDNGGYAKAKVVPQPVSVP